MEQCVLVIDFDNNNFEASHREWLKHGILLCVVNTIPDAIKELSKREFLFTAVFSKDNNVLGQLEILRQIKPLAFLVYPPEYDVATRTVDFFNGIDHFFGSHPVSTDLFEVMRPLLSYMERRSNSNISPIQYHHHRDIFMVVEFRKLYVRGQEIELGKTDFDILDLLLSEPGRVFTYDQIYSYAHSEDESPESVYTAVHSHMKRIRHKIKTDGHSPDYIQSVRSVGYCLRL